MAATAFTLQEWFALAQYEVLLFAAALFAIGLVDELAVDLAYGWLRLTGRLRTSIVTDAAIAAPDLRGPAALFVPAWQEEAVIGLTIRHALSVWPYAELRVFVGCYRNDPQTQAAVKAIAACDDRVRPIIVDADGPTSKAHCLNVLYHALGIEERSTDKRFHMVVLHDAEDMVDPGEIALLDGALCRAEFVQLPVLALPRDEARWIGGHYSLFQTPLEIQRIARRVFPSRLSFPVLPSFSSAISPFQAARFWVANGACRSAPA